MRGGQTGICPVKFYVYYSSSSSWLFCFDGGSGVKANSNTRTGSETNFGNSYKLPEGYTFGSESARNYLSGNYNKWLSTEIEVFQLE